MISEMSILIAGVGGQGTLLTSRILGHVAMAAGYDVKISEVHGMAQRGGSVVTYVKMGSSISSPVIEKGTADLIIAFEELEALRWLEYLKDGGLLILNTQKIEPMPVIMRKSAYPENIPEILKRKNIKTVSADALGTARTLGNIKTVNAVMLGIFARVSGIKKELFTEAIMGTVPEKHIKINLDAFESGYSDGR